MRYRMTLNFAGGGEVGSKPRSNYLAWWVLSAAILITIICKVVPLALLMPSVGLDESWQLAMNHAIAERLSLGRDIVFTFGPYAFLYTRLYHPLIDHLVMASSIYLAASYAFVLVHCLRGGGALRLACFWLALVMPSLSDNIFYLYPLLAGLFCCQAANFEAQGDDGKRWALGRFIIVFFPFGLIGLIKGSFMVACATVAVLAALCFLVRRRMAAAVVVLVVVAASVPFFWIAAGQTLALLPEYFHGMGQLASGYSDAMSLDGRGWEIVAYLVGSLVMVLLIAMDKQRTVHERLFMIAVFALYLFLAFKGGFVRHDGHAIIAGAAILLAAAALLVVQRSSMALVCFFAAACVYALIVPGYSAGNLSLKVLRREIVATYVNAWRGAVLRVTAADQLRSDYDSDMQALGKWVDLPTVKGGVDIYSFGQSYLLASGSHWDPRPVIQSYAAYTPWLARLNSAHLLGEHAPENIWFKIEPIDGHLASTEDGASWPALLTRYQPSQRHGDYLLLTSRVGQPAVADPTLLSGPVEARFGRTIPVPDSQEPVIADVVIKPSLVGRLVDLLYKRHRLAITVNLQDGESRTYRLVAGMAEAGFVISPLVNDTRDFAAVYGAPALLARNRVVSFVINRIGGRREWQPTFHVTFRQLHMPQPLNVADVLGVEKAVASPKEKQVDLNTCSGSIDLVNGAQATPAITSGGNWLLVEGWLAKSVSEGMLPDSTWLIFTNAEGISTYFQAHAKPRPDVAAYFKQPGLAMVGYTVAADVSGMSGEYSLGLGYIDGDRLLICPQPRIKVVLGKVR